MSNTVITNYTDLNGPSTKADSSVVVIVNKDGSLSVDQNLLGTLMGSDGSQAAGISVVRVGHEGRPDDATDSETDDDKVPHVTLSVDSYYDEPNSIIKYDSGAEMLQSLRIETRENSLLGFQNDHCYTSLTSPSQTLPQKNDSYTTYDEPQIEISHTPPPKPVPSSKKITILDQQIITKGKKIVINPTEAVILKGNDILNKPLPQVSKVKNLGDLEKGTLKKTEESVESSSISSSGDSIPDRDSDSDYKDTRDRTGTIKVKRGKLKPRILKSLHPTKIAKVESKVPARLKANKNLLKRDLREKAIMKAVPEKKAADVDIESLIPTSEISVTPTAPSELNKTTPKTTPKTVKKDKKTPAHVTALLSDMTSLFSTPDVIRRVSTDNKAPSKSEKEPLPSEKKVTTVTTPKMMEVSDGKMVENKTIDNVEKLKPSGLHKTYLKQKDKIINPAEKVTKTYELIPQLDDASLAQILQDSTTATSNPVKVQSSISGNNTMNSPGLAGPLSPTLDLLGGLQPEEEGLTEDLLMHVAQLVESSENLQEVIDKQVLGKVDNTPAKATVQSPFQQAQVHPAGTTVYAQSPKPVKTIVLRKDPIEIVRRDGRVITLPPIEAPATRASKRKSQMDTASSADVLPTPTPVPVQPVSITPEPHLQTVSKHYVNKKLANKKEQVIQTTAVDKISAESQESWNSEDDPYRLWCICKQPHNNRFMICCDGCEDWFHGKCVNITKAMGQQMEEQGIEWRCPNCIKKSKPSSKTPNRVILQKKNETEGVIKTPSPVSKEAASKTCCIVCKKPARASSIYCSDACILKHAQDSLVNQPPSNKAESDSGKSQEKQKSESRVIVYERKSGRLLAGPNAPTAENLKAWLQKNPTFEVVRPGTLSTIKPNISKRKMLNEPHKIQTTLNFERIPKKTEQSSSARINQPEVKDRITKVLPSPKEERTPKVLQSPKEDRMPKVVQSPKEERVLKVLQSPKEEKISKVLQSPKEDRLLKVLQSPKGETKMLAQPKTPSTSKSQAPQLMDTPKASTSFAKTSSEPRKLVRATSSRSQSTYEKTPTVSPSVSRKKDTSNKTKMDSVDEIRENVRKALQEQMTIRMAEHDGPKFTEDEIVQFAFDTEDELNELFNKDVGMKYKAKYRSLMFNIKDRKNHSLWQKICDRTIAPKQLVRLSPEELASQELAQWREDEVKHQLELIKKSEIDILAANKTYVLKTHKGEKVMETKESVSTELDPNVPVEDIVTALNDQTVGEVPPVEGTQETSSPKKATSDKKHSSRRKRGREDNGASHSKKKKNRESKRESERRKSRSSRKGSDNKSSRDNEKTTRNSRRRSSRRISSAAKESPRVESKDKSDSSEHSRRISQSGDKSKKRSNSREHSRSRSQGRERSGSRARSRKRSTSRDSSKRKRRSRSKHSNSTEEKHKHRSRSQENISSKNKHDSTDSDSIERPKSAMLKEAHPEYDPHEPMITSAFSEEDLRKSREDVYEDTFKNDNDNYGNADYDPTKSFSMNTEVVLDTPKSMKRQDRISEAESDQEPTSTVDNSSAIVWNGCINMVDVARFYVAAHEVSGSGSDLEEDITAELDIVGRINPDTVWEYIGKMKRASNKDILILKLQAANDEEKMQYIALYSYLSSRNRLGVVKVSNTTSVKDFYIVPLSANTNLPAVLLPFDGPGLGDIKTHLLIAIVIRQRKKRLAPHIPKDIIPAKVARESRKRSYTPPVVNKITYTPPTSPRRRPLPLPTYTSPALSSSVKDKIAASLACADDEEAYSPGSSSSSAGSAPTQAPQQSQPNSNKLRSKMEELNRQIEEQKQQILKMAQADSSVGEDEAYSPSRPMTPPPVVPLADISLPSNLQEILATIKQRSETASDVDMRLPLPP